MTIRMITLGADPETIVARNGVPTHAIGLIGGTKEEPRKIIRGGREVGAVQEDNVLYEFNIMPHDTRQGFIDNIQQMLEVGREILGDGYEITNKTSHIFSDEDMAHFPDSAFIFGCEPDFFAGNGEMNPKPAAPWPGLRTAGGHVHFGFDERVVRDDENVRSLIQLCDMYMALPSMLLDTDDLRKELYGKAGAFRPKAYGAEYRTLSGFWIHNPENTGFVFDQAQKAYDALATGLGREMLARFPYELIVDIINSNDRGRAERALKVMQVA